MTGDEERGDHAEQRAIAQEELAIAQEELAIAQRRVANAQRRVANAQRRVANAQRQLVDEQHQQVAVAQHQQQHAEVADRERVVAEREQRATQDEHDEHADQGAMMTEGERDGEVITNNPQNRRGYAFVFDETTYDAMPRWKLNPTNGEREEYANETIAATESINLNEPVDLPNLPNAEYALHFVSGKKPARLYEQYAHLFISCYAIYEFPYINEDVVLRDEFIRIASDRFVEEITTEHMNKMKCRTNLGNIQAALDRLNDLATQRVEH